MEHHGLIRQDERQLDRRELAAWRGMLATHSALIAQLDGELEREHGLPLTSYEVLLHLGQDTEPLAADGQARRPPASARSGLTRLVDRLADRGPGRARALRVDRRGYYAALTPEGERRFAEARPTHLRGIREHFLAKLDGDDLEALARAWERVGRRTEARVASARCPTRSPAETSPYLLQHKDNPVDWYPWGEEALRAAARARPADPALDRLLGLPLVPRDGARVVRGRARRPAT